MKMAGDQQIVNSPEKRYMLRHPDKDPRIEPTAYVNNGPTIATTPFDDHHIATRKLLSPGVYHWAQIATNEGPIPACKPCLFSNNVLDLGGLSRRGSAHLQKTKKEALCHDSGKCCTSNRTITIISIPQFPPGRVTNKGLLQRFGDTPQ